MTDALEKKDAPAAVERCGLCDAWLCTDANDNPSGTPRMGLCRAHPPTPFLIQGPPNLLDPHQRATVQVMAQFPPMAETGWCRDFDTPETDDAPPT